MNSEKQTPLTAHELAKEIASKVMAQQYPMLYDFNDPLYTRLFEVLYTDAMCKLSKISPSKENLILFLKRCHAGVAGSKTHIKKNSGSLS